MISMMKFGKQDITFFFDTFQYKDCPGNNKGVISISYFPPAVHFWRCFIVAAGSKKLSKTKIEIKI